MQNRFPTAMALALSASLDTLETTNDISSETADKLLLLFETFTVSLLAGDAISSPKRYHNTKLSGDDLDTYLWNTAVTTMQNKAEPPIPYTARGGYNE